MDSPYESKGDFLLLKESFSEFCRERYQVIKPRIFKSLDLDYQEIEADTFHLEAENSLRDDGKKENAENKNTYKNAVTARAFKKECIAKVSHKLNINLVKKGNVYKTEDNKYGIIAATSKVYKKSNGNFLWFAYRRKKRDELKDCKNKLYILGCEDSSKTIMLSLDKFEKHLDELHISKDSDGNISHYHLSMQINNEGRIEWLIPLPSPHIIDLTDNLI